MHEIGVKLRYSIHTIGLIRTLAKCVRYPIDWFKTRKHRKLLKSATRGEIFTKIYEANHWKNSESASGGGSSLYYTENLRKHLPKLFETFAVKTIFDAPCGDFNWMRHVIAETDIRYIGADIVPALVGRLKKEYQSPKIAFLVRDITSDEFPVVDLWICRDCLFHLSYEDIFLALNKFASSRIKYVLASTHIVANDFQNFDIRSGSFRIIDLFSGPFHFSRSVKFRVADWIDNYPPREMCLWTREQIAEALPKMKTTLDRKT